MVDDHVKAAFVLLVMVMVGAVLLARVVSK